jgi:hypothetical protein
MKTLRTLVVVALFATLIGCAGQNAWKPVCRHNAKYAADVVGEKHPTKLVYGTLDGKRHVEAMAEIDGEWQYIRPYFGHRGVLIWTYDDPPVGFRVD